MGCTSCGQTTAVPTCNSCGTCRTCVQTVPRCGCNNCATQCTPYYQQSPTCQEDNSRTVYQNTISQTFKSSSGFCVPACGASVRVTFYGVVDVAIGAMLWTPGIGFLQIEGFNANSQEIELSNPCLTGICGDQAAPGTPVPACTVFVLAVPPCNSSSGGSNSLYPFLASGFVAPGNGNCVDIAVTNVNGLSVNKNISINNGIYRISAITSATQITICNDGDGLVPGTVVNYQDAAGNFIVPIVLIDSNPCLNDAALAGKMLICDSGVMKPLEGLLNNQIPVFDLASGNVNMRSLGFPVLDCTTLTVCLTLDPELPSGTPYIVQVASTADFVDGQIVTIGGTEFTIDSIVNGTTMYIIPIEDPTAVQNYVVGSTLCSADCCTELDVRLVALENTVNLNQPPCSIITPGTKQWWNVNNQISSTPITPSDIDGVTPLKEGNIVTIPIGNDSCKYPLKFAYFIECSWFYRIFGAAGGGVDLIFELEAVETSNPATPLVIQSAMRQTHAYVEIPSSAGINFQSRVQTYQGAFDVPFNTTQYVRAKVNLRWHAANADVDHVAVDALYARIQVIGSAIRT